MPVIRNQDSARNAGASPGLEVRVMVEEEQGAQSLRMGEITVAPNTRLARHIHTNTEEAVVVLEGTLDAIVGRERVPIGPGDAVLTPAGTVHGFLNRSGEPAKLLYVYPTNHVEKVLANEPRSTAGFASESGLKGYASPGDRPLDNKP